MSAVCENHLQREAIGVCIECRRRVCSECSTKVEGINYCVACLTGLAREGGRRAHEQRAQGPGAAYAATAAYVTLLTAGMYFWLAFVLPGG